MFTSIQRQMLVESAKDVMRGRHNGENNDDLDRVVLFIKKHNPEAFHTNETIGERVFFDEQRPSVKSAGFFNHASPAVRAVWVEFPMKGEYENHPRK